MKRLFYIWQIIASLFLSLSAAAFTVRSIAHGVDAFLAALFVALTLVSLWLLKLSIVEYKQECGR